MRFITFILISYITLIPILNHAQEVDVSENTIIDQSGDEVNKPAG